MGKVAAIQMTSSHLVTENLSTAGEMLRAAKDAGAEIACLPENFAFIGLRDVDKQQMAETDGAGPAQAFLRETARALKLWILAGTINIRSETEPKVANASLLIDSDGKRVARYDKIHLFDVTIPGRDEQYRESDTVEPGSKVVVADTPVGRLRDVRLLRHALPRAVPRARLARRRVVRDAGGVYGADRAGALGDDSARARDRESLLCGRAGADRAHIRAAARPTAIR